MSGYIKRNLQYARYLVRHKWFVFQAGRAIGAPLWRLIIHDWSKLLPGEWPAYRNHFYAAPEQNLYKSGRRFTRAWNLHLKRNAHHWQYWSVSNDDGTFTAIEIPDHFVREMVADWCGAGKAINGKWDAIEWFVDNQDKMRLHPRTRQLVVQYLDKALFKLTGSFPHDYKHHA